MSGYSRFEGTDRQPLPHEIFIKSSAQKTVFKICSRLQQHINSQTEIDLSEWNAIDANTVVNAITRLVTEYPFIREVCAHSTLQPFWLAQLQKKNYANEAELGPFSTLMGIYYAELAYDQQEAEPNPLLLQIAAGFHSSLATHTLHHQQLRHYVDQIIQGETDTATTTIATILKSAFHLLNSRTQSSQLLTLLANSDHVPAKLMLANAYLWQSYLTHDARDVQAALVCLQSVKTSLDTSEGKNSLSNAREEKWLLGIDDHRQEKYYRIDELDAAIHRLQQKLLAVNQPQAAITASSHGPAASAA